jgi:hypothetical protein
VSLAAAAVVPGAPLLVPAIAGGSAHLDEELRKTALAAVRWLVSSPDPVVVVGGAQRTGDVDGGWDWSGFGVPVRDGDGPPHRPALPTALGIGAWLLAECGGRAGRFVGVSAAEDAAACRRLGAEVAGGGPVRLLVVGDGSACRSEKAPGHLDPRAEAFDAGLLEGLREGTPERLLALDPGRARELLVTGRAPFQVLAGAAAGPMPAALDHACDPYGVLYVVCRWGQDL